MPLQLVSAGSPPQRLSHIQSHPVSGPKDASLVAFTGWAIMVLWEVAALRLTLPLVRAFKAP